ncbi:hypothetical protein E2C01_013251 [Portunus trituberculatus]|uniref:Uncharacterized protein n=1 Tax=Portunus trituberculatus TaxID=210409 RepID=A0A5B7DGF4_PORTR|nr:hypothetical protein [Portunus trituberculatus]
MQGLGMENIPYTSCCCVCDWTVERWTKKQMNMRKEPAKRLPDEKPTTPSKLSVLSTMRPSVERSKLCLSNGCSNESSNASKEENVAKHCGQLLSAKHHGGGDSNKHVL